MKFIIDNLSLNIAALDKLTGGNGTAVISLGAAAALGTLVGFGTGAALDGLVRRLTAHKVSLNDVKACLGIEGSDLNFSQMYRVADIVVSGGIFKDRSTTVSFKPDAVRIKNLNKELTNTELSLSSNAHIISKARGTENRFFDLEGSRLAGISHSSGGFLQALKVFKSAVDSEVKATDLYTCQQGNVSTSISRRSYILTKIMNYAHERGIAGNYLTVAVKERANTAPGLADVAFRAALRKGIIAGILSPNADAKCYEGMLNAAAVASNESTGQNPDAVISSIFEALKDAGLIEGHLRARFTQDAREKIANPEAEIAQPLSRGLSSGQSWIDRLVGRGHSREDSRLNPNPLQGRFDSSLVETIVQLEARKAEEAKVQADMDVSTYADKITELTPRLEELQGLYKTLIGLLAEKLTSLDKVIKMGRRRLRGTILMAHKQGLDLLGRYEANDAAIVEIRQQIASLADTINASRPRCPRNFRLASKAKRKAVEEIEREFVKNNAQIQNLRVQSERDTAKIKNEEAMLEDDEKRAKHYWSPVATSEQESSKMSGFFKKFFTRRKVEAGAIALTSAEQESGYEGSEIEWHECL